MVRFKIGSAVGSRLVLGVVVALTVGCHRKGKDTSSPEDAPRTVVATPADAAPVYVASSTTIDEPPPDAPEVIGYETLSNGDRVQVVTYVHTYPEPIETFPRVYWSGRWYYNINGDFVYWSPYYGGWVYYWGPPAPLVVAWNFYYPWCPFYWGFGFYGAGWYWGGVSVYGYHAYGLPVHHHDHHHHHDWETRPHKQASRPSKGGPTGSGRPPGADRPPNPGKPGSRPDKDSHGGGAPAEGGGLKARPRPAVAGTKDLVRNPGGDRPSGSKGGPSSLTTVSDAGTRPATSPPRTRYVTGSGQQVTTVNPSAAGRGNARLSADASLPQVPSTAAPSYRPSVAAPAGGQVPPWGGGSSSGRSPQSTRPSTTYRTPGGTPAPTWSSSSARTPQANPPRHSSPTPTHYQSTPSSSSSPSRSSAPMRSPSSSSSPSRSSAPMRAPSRSSSPSRSSGSSSRPRASSASRSFSSSRSSSSRSSSSRSSSSRSSSSRGSSSRSSSSRSSSGGRRRR